jgi:hypothetical protein
MKIEWNYKIKLEDEGIFKKIEQKRGMLIPEKLKEIVIEGNAGTPEKYNFLLGTSEKVFGALLSFNENESDTDSVFTALEVLKNKELIPFGVDPFGNYICYDAECEKVVFWEHESGVITSTNLGLEEFMSSLY